MTLFLVVSGYCTLSFGASFISNVESVVSTTPHDVLRNLNLDRGSGAVTWLHHRGPPGCIPRAMTVQPQCAFERRGHVVSRQLAIVETELAISARQEAARRAFADAFLAVTRTLGTTDLEMRKQFADHAPSLSSTLTAHSEILGTYFAATRVIKAIVESLYPSLTESAKTSRSIAASAPP